MKPARLLVVDDEPSLRETLRDHLTEQGYDVLAVESATTALSQMEAFDPDLVLSDVQMPGMSGFELLARLQQTRPQTDVIIFTGHADLQGAIRAMKCGASDYLIKPIDLDEAEGAIERCLEKRKCLAGEGDAEETPEANAPYGLVGKHPSMVRVYKAIGSVSDTEAVVLIRGDTGTGKELVARAIHDASPRAAAHFVGVNCAAMPTELLESELFGHVKGAFTGASSDRRGKFEVASAGTLFLDEIGDTAPAFQAKLLRVLQEREFYPVGSDRPRRTGARIIAATHRPLEEMVERGEFRQDLLFRLQVIEIPVPPLRERSSDIPMLVRYLLARAAAASGITPPVVTTEVMEHLTAQAWPGNVRELENVITRAVVLSRGPALTLEDLTAGGLPVTGGGARETTGAPGSMSLEHVRASAERQHVQSVLDESRGNKSAAARKLKISRPTLNRLIRDYKLLIT